MSRTLLVLRPEPGATATAQRIAALGREATVAPLFTVAPVAWEPPPPDGFDALLLTSANAARHGGAALAGYAGLPLYAVGTATATAAREAGLAPVQIGAEDAAAIVAALAAGGARHVLHLAGRERQAASAAEMTVTQLAVYSADAVATLPSAAGDALGRGAVALLHSPRAAALFAGLVDAAGIGRGDVAIAAISPAARDAAGDGWLDGAVAAQPGDDALLAAAAALCDQAR